MTREEKIKLVEGYCSNFDICEYCALDKLNYCRSYFENWEDSFLDEAVALINKTSDNVNHPEHYSGKHECIDVMVAMFGVEAVKHFCMCNSFKYRFRADRKNGEEDIKKAEWCEDKLIELGGVDGNAN